MMSKNLLLIGIFSLIFSLVSSSALALTLVWPGNGASEVSIGCTPPPGAPPGNCSVEEVRVWDDPTDADAKPECEECYFQWGEVTGAVKYILDIDQFTQSEDNILPSVCSGGVCSFGFLALSVGNINYLTAYTWKVTAYDLAGNPIDSSATYSFTTESAPAPPPPPPGPGPGPGPGPIGPLINPLKCETLECALNALINFLFYLAMALAPIMIIWAAFLILTAAGKAEQVNKGKTIIFWTVIAVAIVLLAKGLPSIIKGIFGG